MVELSNGSELVYDITGNRTDFYRIRRKAFSRSDSSERVFCFAGGVYWKVFNPAVSVCSDCRVKYFLESHRIDSDGLKVVRVVYYGFAIGIDCRLFWKF